MVSAMRALQCPASVASLVLMGAASAFVSLWRSLEPPVSEALVRGLAAGGQPAGAALIAALAASTSPAGKLLSFLAHLPQLTYYILYCQWSCLQHPTMLIGSLLGAAACRAWSLKVGTRRPRQAAGPARQLPQRVAACVCLHLAARRTGVVVQAGASQGCITAAVLAGLATEHAGGSLLRRAAPAAAGQLHGVLGRPRGQPSCGVHTERHVAVP
jgi:hypothetical protein